MCCVVVRIPFLKVSLPYFVRLVRNAVRHSVFVTCIYLTCFAWSNLLKTPMIDAGSQSSSTSLRVHWCIHMSV